MPIELTTTAPGAAALETLALVVAESKAGDPLAPVTVLVPTNAAGVLARRALARRGGIAAVQFLTVYRLAQVLGGAALAEAGRRPVSTPLLSAAIGEVLTSRPGRFAPVHRHPATIAAVLSAARELRQVPRADLERLGRDGTPMAQELVRVTADVRAVLAERWHDEADLLTSARRSLTGESASAIGPVIVHLPIDLTPPAAGLIRRLGELGAVRVVLDAPQDRLAAPLAARLADQLGVALPGRPPDRPAAPTVEVISVSDADEEVRAAVRQLVRAALDGIPLERMALLWSTAEPYQRLVGEHLEAAGIRWNGPSPLRLSERLAGRTLLALLQLDRFGLHRSDLFGLLGTAALHDRRGRPVPAAAWERTARDAGIGHGEDWALRLAEYGALRRQAADAAADAGDERTATRSGWEAEHAAGLEDFVGWLRDELGSPTDQRPWRDWVDWAQRILRRLLGGEPGRQRLSTVERDACERLDGALDRLRELDQLAPPVTRGGFHDAALATIDAELLRSGRIGEGVLAGGMASAIGLSAELVVVLGMAEGTMPTAPPADPLLPDGDRRLVAPALATRELVIARQRSQLLAALGGAPRAVVCVPRGDLRHSSVRQPSRWLAELVPADSRVEHAVASFAAGLVGAEFPATAGEHRIRALLAHRRSGSPIDGHPLVAADVSLQRALRMRRGREQSTISEFDGDLSGIDVPSPLDPDALISATRLEAWATCPLRYLLRHVLHVAEPDDRGAQLRISALDRGSLLHTTIDRFLRRVLDGELTTPLPEQSWSIEHRRAALSILDEECSRAERAGLSGRALLWERDRRVLRAELAGWFAVDDDERARRGLTPVASEVAFGRAGDDWAAPTLDLPGGRRLRLSGAIDRLDRTTDGRFVVTDHKTGRHSRYRSIRDGDEFAAGTKLQLAAYAAAVGQRSGSTVGIETRYAFTASGRRIGYTVTDEVWERFIATVDVIASGISAGLFPAHPEPPVYQPWVSCPVCDPDGLGTGDAYRRWTHHLADPRLAAYVELVGENAGTVDDGADQR